MQFTRDFYIHKGATKIADKQSDAVAYVYERNNVLFAQMFFGKQAKPAWHYRFADAAKREKAIKSSFANWQESQSRKAAYRAERVAATHNFETGHVLRASWGYDQTNVDFYQVTKVISPKMVELRSAVLGRNDNASSLQHDELPDFRLPSWQLGHLQKRQWLLRCNPDRRGRGIRLQSIAFRRSWLCRCNARCSLLISRDRLFWRARRASAGNRANYGSRDYANRSLSGLAHHDKRTTLQRQK